MTGLAHRDNQDAGTISGAVAGGAARLFVLCLCLFLVSCSSPTGVKFLSNGDHVGAIEPIFVATAREPVGEADFDGSRANKLSFASYAISIPQTHEVGKIEWPRHEVKPQFHFAVAQANALENASDFKANLNKSLSTSGANVGRGGKEVMLFVHGYNTDFSEGLYRTAQMKHDFELNMPVTLFSWPSAGKTELYMYDRDSVKISRNQLEDVINLLVASNADQVTLVAHSLGSELLMETLRQIALTHGGKLPAKIKTIILISPDVDIDVFNNQLATIRTLPVNFAVFVSQDDQALRISSLLSGSTGRVGNLTDVDRIKRDGILVVDVTQFKGGDSLNHMTAVTSPGLVSVLKGFTHSDQRDFLRQQGTTASLGKTVVDTATLPLTLVMKTTQSIFKE